MSDVPSLLRPLCNVDNKCNAPINAISRSLKQQRSRKSRIVGKSKLYSRPNLVTLLNCVVIQIHGHAVTAGGNFLNAQIGLFGSDQPKLDVTIFALWQYTKVNTSVRRYRQHVSLAEPDRSPHPRRGTRNGGIIPRGWLWKVLSIASNTNPEDGKYENPDSCRTPSSRKIKNSRTFPIRGKDPKDPKGPEGTVYQDYFAITACGKNRPRLPDPFLPTNYSADALGCAYSSSSIPPADAEDVHVWVAHERDRGTSCFYGQGRSSSILRVAFSDPACTQLSAGLLTRANRAVCYDSVKGLTGGALVELFRTQRNSHPATLPVPSPLKWMKYLFWFRFKSLIVPCKRSFGLIPSPPVKGLSNQSDQCCSSAAVKSST